MKKQNISNPFSTIVRKSLFVLGLAGLIVVNSASAAAAQDSIKKDSDPVVSYIGTLDGQPVFRVRFDNQDGSIYNLSIIDEEGALLYSEKVKGKEFSKKFKFEPTYHEGSKIRFVLSGDKGEKKTQVFQVNTNVQVLTDVVVTKL
jgi:hypothetical protein